MTSNGLYIVFYKMLLIYRRLNCLCKRRNLQVRYHCLNILKPLINRIKRGFFMFIYNTKIHKPGHTIDNMQDPIVTRHDTALVITEAGLYASDIALTKCVSCVACVHDIDSWIRLINKLKMNRDKTELLVLSSSYLPLPLFGTLTIASETVNCSCTAKNIGVVSDGSLSFVPHIMAVCKPSFFHLRNIAKIRKFFTHDTTKIIVHAFVTSRIDYCNSLLYNQPKCILNKL